MVRETRHLWVGNLPENVRDDKIIEHFKRYGRVESVKILPKRGSDGGVAAFVDFVDIKSAQKAHNAVNKMGDRDLRTDYNEPGTIPGAARVLDETVSITSRSREVSGFRAGGGGTTYGPPQSLHAREGRYERRLDGASDTRERSYEHSAYGHHERGTAGGFERTRHYDQDYYRDARDRTLQHGIYYNSRRSPSRFDAHDPRYESRTREQFTLPSVVHRDIYRTDATREVRGRRPERTYQHSRSRSPHSSQSRNQSPQRLASQASRPARSPSGSGSRSRSSSSDSLSSSSSTSSDSSDSSSTSSDESPARSVQSAAVPAPPSQPILSMDKDEPRKSFGIKVQNLPVRSTDSSLKDGLFHEFKKYGKVTSVQIHGVSEERYGLVFFRQQEDQEKALNASKGKLFFGMQIEVTAWVGPETESENEFRPLDERIDEFHPKATRTLFIGNLEKTTTHLDLHNVFQRFGEIVDIDVKKVNGVPQYAFLQYCDITSVCKAIKKMDGEYLGNNRLKLGFGKSMPTNCVWIDGLSSSVTEQYLTRHFSRYGPVLKVDFANQESQLAFYGTMESSGQDIRDIYEIISERRSDETRRGSFHEFTTTERTYFDSARTPGTYQEETRREYPARSREFYPDWESYQGDYYEQRYYDESREYRDFRDPYEQDIREYSYRRERERERERDSERRQTERSQSPTHSRRPQSPAASPSQSERITSDPERRIYSRSSDRSGSCSSVSPSRFDKADKARTERYIKSEKLEKERTFDSDRTDKEKRLLRKEKTEKGEKDKSERSKRKSKNHSTSSQSSETDQDNEKEPSLEKQKGSAKELAKEKNDKECTSKNRLDLMPCVVLTRVNEKEGKVFDTPTVDKASKNKTDSEIIKSPLSDQKIQIIRLEQPKFEQIKTESSRTKVPKEKLLSSHIEVVDKEGKQKLKKHLKSEQPAEGAMAADLDKLEARKRRFADANLKCERQKLDVRRSNQEEEDSRLGSRKPLESVSSRDFSVGREIDFERKGSRKDLLKRESRKNKPERLFTISSPKDGQDLLSVGVPGRSNTDLPFRLVESGELGEFDSLEQVSKKMNFLKNIQRHTLLSEDNDKDPTKDDRKMYSHLSREMAGMERSETVEKLAIDIDHTQSYRKQMEQNRKLKQQMELEILKSEKFRSPNKEAEEYERRSLVHEVGKPPQDVTDDSPPTKKKKNDLLDYEIITKPERHYRSSRQISDEPERMACSPGMRPFGFNEDDYTVGSPRLIPIKEFKESPHVDEKSTFSNLTYKEEHFKLLSSETVKKESITDPSKGKIIAMSPEEEYSKWDNQLKQESNRVDISFPSNIMKRESIRKRPRDLEPGEVQSDSDEDGDLKPASPKVSSLLDGSRFSFLLRDGEDKLRDKEERLSGSLERNKFYSFALDKTITPDTKALLERAKSLSSSREENWSFLDWDSRFANFRSNKGKEKVDSAPRPIPSWYMKKKKIKTDSDGKSDDKKEDHKEEEQEKQELFASRFLHSSIFEQDSKRLQHLERKDDDSDVGAFRPYGRQLSSDGVSYPSDLVQEPVVLFHSRFVELTKMQQKEREKEQKPKEVEKFEEKEIRPKTPESSPECKEREIKSPVSVVPTPATLPPPEQPASIQEKVSADKTPPQPPETVVEKPAEPCEPAAEEAKLPSVVLSVPAPAHPPSPVEITPVVEEAEVPDAITPQVPEEVTSTEQPSYLDTKPPTPGASFSEVSADPVTELKNDSPAVSPPKNEKKIEEPVETLEEETAAIANADTDVCQKSEPAPDEAEPLIPEIDTEVEAPNAVKNKKAPKGKRSTASDKPATRKSVRIDREKRNRSSSPRGDPQKHLEIKSEHERSSRSSAKSPSAVPEPDISEPALPRTRRNVRSVYATTGDNDGVSSVKESTETSRYTRKKPEKDPAEPPATAPPTPRRGRPPKVRKKTIDDVSPIKAEPLKQENEEPDVKEATENAKPVEGWRSPRSQKLSHSPLSSSQQGKKSKSDSAPQAQESSAETSEDGNEKAEQQEDEASKTKLDKEEIGGDNPDIKDVELEKCPTEKPLTELPDKKISLLEKATKPKVGRPKNPKNIPHLKKVEIRLNAVDVKDALRPHNDAESTVVSPVKMKSPQKEDNASPPFTNPPEAAFPETLDKETVIESKISSEAVQLAKQIELEQAVENIEKITETAAIPAYKGPQSGEVSETRPEEEGDKPAHQASETELAAAIGSIICDISTDAESFPPAPPYPPEREAEIPPESTTAPATTQPDDLQPETDQAVNLILQTNVPPSSGSAAPAPVVRESTESIESKEPEVTFTESSNPAKETETLREFPPKQKGRNKGKRKGRKCGKSRDTVESNNVFVRENIQSKSPVKDEKVSSDEGQKEQPREESASSIPDNPVMDTSLNSSSDTVSKEGDEEFKDEEISGTTNMSDSPQTLYIDDVSQSSFKLRSSTESAPVTPPSVPTTVLSTTSGKAVAPVSAAPLAHSTPAIMSDWIVRHEENSSISTPPPPPPALPPDTKASDVDTSSSTLRKILMEPKYVSAPSNTTSIVTAAITEPLPASHVEEHSPPPVEAIKPVSEEKSAIPLANTVVPPAAEAPAFQEKGLIVAHKATSVISRLPPSFDPDDLTRRTLPKPAPPCIPSPKIKGRQNANDGRACIKQTMTVIEERPTETGPSPGLRVNTSQGVMLLTYSGQKTEGPQRISAKISQIPPASAVDIEIQQSVSKSQIKQEPLTPSQMLPKAPPTPSGYQYNASPVISSIKQEKPEHIHISVPNTSSQTGTVKVLTQNAAPVLMHSQMLPGQMGPSGKKMAEVLESKVLQTTNMSPHHSSLSNKIPPEANHVASGSNTPTDRALPHLNIKQEPHSPCAAGHSPSPFARSCHPSVTASSALTNNASVMLGPGIPVPPYIPSMHPEQTVIMPPHSVAQPVSLGHLAQADGRINTPPLQAIQYGIRPEALHSPRAAMQPQMDVRPQRSSTPQPATIREVVHPTMSSKHAADEEMRYHHTVGRGSAHVQPEVLVMQHEYRMPTPGMRLDPYSVPQDVMLPRMMMHSHISAVGEHHQESRRSRTPEGPVKTPPASKTPQPVKDMVKQPDVKLSHSQHNDARMLSGLSLSQPVVVSHGVPLIHPSGSSFHDYRPVYTDIRNYHPAAPLPHPSFSGTSTMGLQSRSMTPSQGGPDNEHSHANPPVRSKTPQISQDPKGVQSSVSEAHHVALGRHSGQMESHIPHLQRAAVETSQTSYPSPVTITLKQELPSPHQSQKQAAFMSSSASAFQRPEVQSLSKPEPPQRSVDMVQLLTKYPIVWQGLLALKNDTAAVQLHFVSGNNVLAHRSLPAPEGGPPLRIAQRMRLEATQLEGVARRMMVESDYCLLLALPCGRDQEDVVNQTESLKAAFITYLQAKQAAGIINVPNPGSNQPAYVLQIFPPCEFSESHLSRLAPDLLASISNISPHLMIVIASA
ncbi:msx2-interacting protein-like isoform X3 [Phyllobates terribilis]|uniref:msx2-interacting protein-like isoform X3 n=1 Tax=Phyllobates terribilis TaxID=111132 RepID=UPI003CCB6783